MLKSAPFKIRLADVSSEVEGGKPILRAHVDGEMRYRLTNEHRKLTGKFGIQRVAYDQGYTDGVLFVIEYLASDGNRTSLFQRELDPKARPKDRGEQSFDIVLPDHAEGVAILRTTNLPAHHTDWDWSYWTELELQE